MPKSRAGSTWQAGEFVQNVFPELSASEREVLVSGSHAECFELAFPDDGDDFPDDDDDFPEYELP